MKINKEIINEKVKIKKTLDFSIILMISSLSFTLFEIENLDLLKFITFQQMFLPLMFFGLFNDGFKDIRDFGYNINILKKVIKICIVNWILLIFILIINSILKLIISII
jgi:hypothetical protein